MIRETDVRRVQLRPAGMFSNVNEVVQQLHVAERDGFVFHVEWRQSHYADPDRGANVWDYYFQQPHGVTHPPADAPLLPRGRDVVCRSDNIITPCRINYDPDTMYLPVDTTRPHRLIADHIKLNNSTRAALESAWASLPRGPMIGAHIRGIAGVDGGQKAARAEAGFDGCVPFPLFYDAIDAALADAPASRLLLCTDDSDVVDTVRARYGERLCTYDAVRLPQGEMHKRQFSGEDLGASPYRLGLDVIIESYLLARCDLLIHDYSNVSRFARCVTPDQPKVCIYNQPERPGPLRARLRRLANVLRST